MYVAQCYAGFPMPLKAGKFEVCGVRATPTSAAAAARMTLLDDDTLVDGDRNGKMYSATDSHSRKTIFADVRTAANESGNIDVIFPAPIKMRYGVSVAGLSNIIGGSITLYIR